jgi:hypothetical protein
MKQDYEGQGVEWFFRIVFALTAVGVVGWWSLLGWIVWRVFA